MSEVLHWIRKTRASGWYSIVEFKLISVSFWIKWCSHMLYYLLNWISLSSNLPNNNIKEKRIEKKFLMLIYSFLITTVPTKKLPSPTLNYLLSLLFNFVSDVIHFIISKYDAWFLWLKLMGFLFELISAIICIGMKIYWGHFLNNVLYDLWLYAPCWNSSWYVLADMSHLVTISMLTYPAIEHFHSALCFSFRWKKLKTFLLSE